jgi:endonuclease I
MKQISLIRIVLIIGFLSSLGFQSKAQAPEGYYDSAYGKMKEQLKTALKEIIVDHTELSYSDLWTAFKKTDNKGNNMVWDMYSDGNSIGYSYSYFGGYDQCGNYSKEGDCYNREHSMPKSWFNDGTPMYTDIFHLYPTDGYVNGKRGNDPFGEVGSASWTSSNGSKLGNSNFPGYSKRVFEPVDVFKGDFARTYFYMVTCYEDRVSSWNSDMLQKNKYPAFTAWAQNLLLKWSRNDPVSQKEIDRNNEAYKLQKNRNPFIDFPQLAEYIWGDSITYVFDPNAIPPELPEGIEEIDYYKDPVVYTAKGSLYVANSTPGAIVRIYNTMGQLLSETVSTSGNYSIRLSEDKIFIVKIIDKRGVIKTIKAINN